MNYIKKRLLQAAGVCVVLGIVVSAAGTAILWKTSQNRKMTEYSKTFPAEFAEISLEMDSSDIRVYPAEGNSIELTYDDDIRERYTVLEEGGKLIVRQRERKPWYAYLAIQLFNRSQSCALGIPASYAGRLVLRTGMGDIDLTGVALQKELEAKAVTGDIRLRQASAVQVTAEVAAGDLKLAEVKSAGGLALHLTTGDVNAEDTSCAGALAIRATTGDIHIRDTSADTYELTLVTGDIKFDRIQIGSSAAFTATTGDIGGTVADLQSEFRIEGGTKLGDIRIPQVPPTGTKTIQAKTVTGDISLAFTQ